MNENTGLKYGVLTSMIALVLVLQGVSIASSHLFRPAQSEISAAQLDRLATAISARVLQQSIHDIDPNELMATNSVTAQPSLPNEQQLADSLRSVIRDELGSYHAGLSELNSDGATESTPGAYTDQERAVQQESYAFTEQLIEAAVIGGVWHAEDTNALMQHVSTIPESRLSVLRERFLTAVNQQTIAVESFPPF